ncbi:VacJ family lipoprotein [Magnetovibrio sp.]|uniref:MlaA family lipoprotein n=1 Tax=Magnetovibrio sp. TaxID=2024836 RepID=UPI002F940721
MFAKTIDAQSSMTSRIFNTLHQNVLRICAVFLLGFLVTACASAPDPNDPEAVAEYNEINDPLEPFNRAMFEFNRGLDTLLLRPAATLYRGFVPPPIQDIVSNFLNNLKTPVVLLNDLLQGEGDRAMTTFSRFAINTTVGILGFGDPATSMGYPAHKEDFGQSLATWGVDGGPYLVLPILGPSNPRDAVGKVVDVLTDPVWHYAQNTDKEYIPNERFVAEAIDFRARNMDAIDDMEKTSLDYYAAVRSLYRQVRADEIRNGATPTHGLPSMSQNNGSMPMMEPMDDPDAEEPMMATKN